MLALHLNLSAIVRPARVSPHLAHSRPQRAKLSSASKNSSSSARTLVVSTRSYTQNLFKPQIVHSEFPKFTEKIKEPLEIRLSKKQKALFVKWENGCEIKLPAEFLRVESPSAEVQGHGGASEKRLIFGRMHVNIIGIEPQGHYGVLLKFDDLHESGIYSWEYLHYLGVNKFALMKRYIKNLRAVGKSRNPALNQRPVVK